MKRPIDRDFDTIRDYMVAMEAYVTYLEDNEKNVEEQPLEVIYFRGAVVEDEYACFEASMNKKEDKDEYYGFSITYTDKRVPKQRRKSEYWDNEKFFNGLLEGDYYSTKSIHDELLEEETEKMLFSFLQELKDQGWF